MKRREFFSVSAAGLILPGLAGAESPGPSSPWKRAYMLGGLRPGKVRETFQLLKEAGFEGVELISPNDLDRKEVLEARDSTGLVIHGVSGSRHWKDTLSDPDPAVVERGLAAIRQEIEDCKAYGGTTVLVVPAVVTPKVSYQQAWERSQRAIRTLLPAAEKAGIVLAIEEVWNKFLLSPLEFARYVDEFDSPFVKAYFDVGNVVEFGYPQEWVRTLGKRIVKVHIKEYAKPKRFDYLLGEGDEIDWGDVRAAFREVGYQGWITAEVPLRNPTDIVRRMNQLFELS